MDDHACDNTVKSINGNPPPQKQIDELKAQVHGNAFEIARLRVTLKELARDLAMAGGGLIRELDAGP